MYLQEECNYMLKPLKGNTGISIKSDLPIIESQVYLAKLGGMKQIS